MLSNDLKGAVSGFVVLLSKGLLEDERWSYDLDKVDRNQHRTGFCDPTVLKTTLAVFLNTLQADAEGNVLNYRDARFRAFQYFRALVDPTFSFDEIHPPFTPSELEEPDWMKWES